MMRTRLFTALVLVALMIVGTAPTGPVEAAGPAAQLEGRVLLEALRGGGYSLLFRHAASDRGQTDSDRQNLDNCATQRNLSDAGREQSVRIGEEIRRLGIPIGAVLASPYCRTLETARLAFGDATPTWDLVSDLSDPTPGAPARLAEALHSLLAQLPEPGTNTVLVTHVTNISDALGTEIEEGDALVVVADGVGGLTIVAQVGVDTWSALDAAP